MKLRFILVLLGTLGIIVQLSATESFKQNKQQVKNIKGKTFEIETVTVTNDQLIQSLKEKKAIKEAIIQKELLKPDPTYFLRSKKKGENFSKSFSISKFSKCPPPPPPAVTGVPVPQNPNALPGAFYPNPLISNNLISPPQRIGLTFIGGQQGTNPSFVVTPPDTCLAVGKSQVVVGDNTGLVSFDKQGQRQSVADAEIGSLLNLDGNFTEFISPVDTRIRFDHDSKRFFVIAANLDVGGNQLNNGVSLGVSSGSEINAFTEWTVLNIFNLDVIPDRQGCPGDQNTLYDFPCMGIDKNAVYIGYNILDANTNFVSGSLFVIQKKSLLEKKSAVVTAFRDVLGFPGDSFPIRGAQGTLQPAMNFDHHQKYGYIISTDPTMFGRLIFCRVIKPGSKSPSLSPFIPIDVLKTGSFFSAQTFEPFRDNLYDGIGLIEYVDDRLQMAHVINHQLYTAHAIVTDANGIGDQNGDRLASRWYQIDLTGDKKGRGTGKEKAITTPALVQAGTLFDSSPIDPLFYNFPAIMTNKRGDLTLCGTVSSQTQPLSAFFVGRLSSDVLGTLRIGSQPPNVYAVGSRPFTRNLSFFGQRWGDLSYTDLDPEDNMTMWTLQEIAIDGVEVQVVGQLIAP